MVQAVLAALAVTPRWMFIRRAFGGGKATAGAYLVFVVYGLSWPIGAAAFDFHEVAFAPVLTVLAVECAGSRTRLELSRG